MICLNNLCDPPEWALLQHKIMNTLNDAADEFVERYTRPDGTLVWREEWPGMDGSDDSYEGFMHLPLLYVLGGKSELNSLSRKLWDAFTWQWTQYGQIHREFDAYYDWMHHGESSLFIYYLGLADPTFLKDRQRSLQFADMYTGDDPEALNYDKELKLIRSPINGSRGPRFNQSEEDWSTHREVLNDYPPPFEDISRVPGPTCEWTDDRIYADILERINARMAKGDVPLNLTATSLVTHAYMYSSDERYRSWVLEYLEAWKERTERNGGITPDNVGLSGQIGEHMDGKWWGGYYGWRWPHGSFTILEPLLIACSNAMLLEGKTEHLNLVRSQIDMLWNLRKTDNGNWVVPNKHLDLGWTDYRQMELLYPLYCWSLSLQDEDLDRLMRLKPDGFRREAVNTSTDHYKGSIGNYEPWFEFIRGNNPEYPEKVLRANYKLILEQLDIMRSEQGDPTTWDIHHWQTRTPFVMEGLIQTMLGTPMHIYHGGLLFAPVRYFDGDLKRPGLPEKVAALVERLEPDSIILTLVNMDPMYGKQIIIQAGTFGEHQFLEVVYKIANQEAEETVKVEKKHLTVKLGPSSEGTLKLSMSRFVNLPTYDTPWVSQQDYSYRIKGRS